MSTQSLLVSGNTPLLYNPSADTDHDPSAGVSQEQVDAHTLEVMELLFKERGLRFLAALLRLAQVKQRALPGLSLADCAVITAKTIRDLAKRLSQPGNHWGYDTTQKYLVVLCALQILYKGKSPEGGIEYHFPLCRYSPPATLDPLEKVIGGSRNKVQSFARKAKQRFLIYLQQQPSSPSLLPVPPSRPFDLSGAVEDIEQILQEELGKGALQEHLLLKMSGVLRYRCQSSSDEQTSGSLEGVIQNGRLSIQRGDLMPFPDEQESPIFAQEGDFLQKASRNGQLLTSKGDSSGVAMHKSRPFPRMDDSNAISPLAPEPKKSPISAPKGDSAGEESPKNGRLSATTGDSGSQTGDFASSETSNVNVILHDYIHSFLNDNDKSKVVEVLRTIFGEGPGKRGYYHNLYKNGYRSPIAWLAAAIETLIAYRKKTTERPGNYFYDLCVTFHQNGVPRDAIERAGRYGTLSYGQLLEALERPAPSSRPSPSLRVPLAPPPAPLELRIPRTRDRSGMDRAELAQAYQLLHCSPFTLRVAAYRQQDGTGALLVDDRMGHQCWVYSQRALAVSLPLAKNAPDLLTRLQHLVRMKRSEQRSHEVEPRGRQ